LFRIRKTLPHAYYRILESYLTDRCFQVKFKSEITTLSKTEAGVPQGSVLGPVLYRNYTSAHRTSDNTTAAAFAHDTAILATDEDPAIDSIKLQATINKINDCPKKWRIKMNHSKSTHIAFTLRNQTCPAVQMGNVDLPQKNKMKYLSKHFDTDTGKAHQNQKKPAQPKSETNALAPWKKISIINRKQIPPIQSSTQTHLDLRPSAMGTA
jgi:hypothetical protein